jgi:hypothetical protein
MARHSRSSLPLATCLLIAAAWSSTRLLSCFLSPAIKGASLRKSATARRAVATAVDEELDFAIGQRVTIMAPPVMQGKQGDVVSHIPHSNSFAVRLDSGSVFNFVSENLQSASSPVAAAPASPAPAAPIPAARRSNDDDEPAFEAGQRVVVLAPPAMQGKQGTVVGPMGDEAFAVRLDSGSVFNFMTVNLQDASAPVAAAPAAPAVAAVARGARKSMDDDEPAFAEGQKVVILGPLAMKGTQATVVGQIRDDAFAVRLDSGSVFHILTDNLQDASGAPAAVAAPATPVLGRKPADASEEPAFAEGEPVMILGPPAMQGKRGIVVKHLPVQDSFAVRLESGSVFNFFTENLKKA